MSTEAGAREIDIFELRDALAAGALLVDVREDEEWDEGHIEGALHIPLGELADRAPTELPDRDASVALYCAVGRRSLAAAELLAGLGYRDTASLEGGIWAFMSAGGELVAPVESAR